MSKHSAKEVLPVDLREHRAVQVWSQLGPERVQPQKIEILKAKRKTAVYRLAGVGPDGSAVIAKKCRARTAFVERMIYEEFLPRLPLSALRCYGFVAEPDGEFCWLFLEDANGEEYSPLNEQHRALAGRWLAQIHLAATDADWAARLPDRGPAYYFELLRSARTAMLECMDHPALSAADASLLRSIVAQCDRMESHLEALGRFCEGLPRAVVHGDFAIKNLRLRNGATGSALLAFDWEMAGWGVPGSDLAQIGRCASPDLEVYGSVLRRDFPQLEISDIQLLGDYGNLLRLIDKIFWETISLAGDSYVVLLKPLLTLRKYETQLRAALSALDRRQYDHGIG